MTNPVNLMKTGKRCTKGNYSPISYMNKNTHRCQNTLAKMNRIKFEMTDICVGIHLNPKRNLIRNS